MLNLIAKDFKRLFANKNSVKKNVASIFISLLAFACLVAVEYIVFTLLLKKLQTYAQATMPFLTVFLTLVSAVMIFTNMSRANKLFFDKTDVEQLIKRPITNFQIVSSKIIFLFFSHYLTTLLLVYPLAIAYGSLHARPAIFYYQIFFYPILSFCFEAGVALIFVYPFRTIVEFLKKHIYLQFIVAIFFMAIGCYIYGEVLSFFMNLVVNNDVGSIFTKSSIQALSNLRQYLIPVNFFADIFFASRSGYLFPCICIVLGVFSIGTTIVVFAFNYFRSTTFSQKKKKERPMKVLSVKRALLKKELILLFKDSGNVFSFTGLLIVQPFLLYNVISSMNLVFSSGVFSYYILALPELIPLMDALLVMLFTVIINQGANEYVQAEKANVRLMKTIPVSPTLQILLKVVVPFSLSFLSLFVSVIVLMTTGALTFVTGCFALILSTLLLAIFDVVSLNEEMAIRNTKPRSSLLSSFYSYALPILYFAVAILSCNAGLSLTVAFLVGMVVLILISVPYFYNIQQKVATKFLDLELVN